MTHTGLGGQQATVGFNAGDMMNFALVSGSNSADIINIDSTSNVGVPGKWVFQVNQENVTGKRETFGCIAPAVQYKHCSFVLQESKGLKP